MSETTTTPAPAAPAAAPAAPAAPATRNPAELMAELAAERVSKRDLEARTTQLQEELGRVRTEAEKKTQTEVAAATEKLSRMQKRVVDAELRGKAAESGLADLDLLAHPLLDRSKIVVDEEGNVSGIAEAFEELKSKKPEWFKKPGTPQTQAAPVTTGAPTPNPASAPSTADVNAMTPEEYRKFRADFMRKLRVVR